MPQIDIMHLFLLFIIYSFCGWLCEEIWVGIGSRKLVYRGMLYGPICPIYGFGCLGILYILYPLRNKWITLFIASFFVTSALEYVSSWLLEKLFHAKWWDYSKKFMNINGRVCLLNSCAFGIGGIALEHLVHPFMMQVVYFEKIQCAIPYFFYILLTILLVDWFFTTKKLVDFTTSLERIKGAAEHLKEQVQEKYDARPQNINELLETVKKQSANEKIKISESMQKNIDILEAHQKQLESWIKKYPSMKSKEYEEALNHAKANFQKKIEETKQKKIQAKAEKAQLKLAKKQEKAAAKRG